MKIKKTYKSILRKDEYVYDVFGIYWDNQKTYFAYLDPNDDYAIHIYCSNEVEVIDPNINFRSVFNYGTMSGIFHWSLIERELWSSIIDNIGDARKDFLSIIRQENLIDY